MPATSVWPKSRRRIFTTCANGAAAASIGWSLPGPGPLRYRSASAENPRPTDGPGYLRVDTVHQGDLDGAKGVYHINAMDEVTQWQVVGAVEHISEAWLEPLLLSMLEQFPFRILGFHSDNGSEFINHNVET